MGKIDCAAITHPGRARTNNEDNFCVCGMRKEEPDAMECCVEWQGADRRAVFSVCDGMGGEAAGEEASFLAVQTVKGVFWEQAEHSALLQVQLANEKICSLMQKNGGVRMGSTWAALYLDRGWALACNVGDSRIYRLRNKTLEQLSQDHSQAQSLVRMGLLSKMSAQQHPGKHQLTQHLGIFPEEMILQPYLCKTELKQGDRYLLCSDGLTDMVTETAISEILAQPGGSLHAAQNLVQAALGEGGRDNVTAVVVWFDK